MRDMIETAMPRQRRLYRDGNKWCAVGLHFRNLAIDLAGFGDTQVEAVSSLNTLSHEKSNVKDFEVGGFCRQCTEWVAEEDIMEGCRDPDCPCN